MPISKWNCEDRFDFETNNLSATLLMSIVDLHFDKYIRAHLANHHNKHNDIDFAQSFIHTCFFAMILIISCNF